MSRFFSTAALLLAFVFVSHAAKAEVEIEEHTSPGGQVFWLVQEDSIPIVSIEIGFANGAWNDAIGKEGLIRFAFSLLGEGAGDMESIAYEQYADDISARIGFGSGRDGAWASARFLAESLDAGVDLFGLTMTQPRFDEEPVARTRRQILSGIASAKNNPSSVAAQAWFARAFPDHPYGRGTRGTEESIAGITVEDLRAAQQRVLVRAGAIVSIVGAINPQKAGEVVDRLLAGLPEGTAPEVPVAQSVPPPGIHVIAEDVPQSVALFGQKGISRDDPDWVPAAVMNYILGGGGLTSRLTEEVRERRGLAYSVSSSFRDMEGAGIIIGSVQTENARIGESLEVIKAEWRRMAEGGVTEEELQAAKTYLTGSFPLGFDSNGKIANYLGFVQNEKLGIDHINRRNGLIEAVTREDVQRAAARLLDADALSIVVVGQPEGL
ncbi:MAG: M16 family metallopeptidase [Paracoccaceae bacterium]